MLLNLGKTWIMRRNLKMYLNNYIRPFGHTLFGIRDIFGIKLLTKIRVGFSDLRDHR